MKYLIVIDMQNDFLTGSLSNARAQAVIAAAVREVTAAKQKGYGIVFTQDTHHEDYLTTREGSGLPVVHCVANSWGWQICDELAPFASDAQIVEKNNFGYLGWKELLDAPSEIELLGVCTDICVVSNALILRAVFPDAYISVKAECCAGISENLHNAALDVMKSCHIAIV